MSKKTEQKEMSATVTPVAQTNVPAVAQAAALPATKPQASAELLERIGEVRDNLQAVEEFRLPRIRMTSGGAEITEGEEPVQAIEGIILHAKKTNVFYAKPYNPSDVNPPDCFSLDGERPDASIEKPQHPTCKGCPKAEFGTNSMGSGKACRNLKPLYFLTGDGAIMPRQLTISPTSLKAANAYIMDLTAAGYNFRKVKTRIEFFKENPKDTYMKAKFKKVGVLDAQQKADVDALLEMWKPMIEKQTIDQSELEGQASQANAAAQAQAANVSGDF